MLRFRYPYDSTVYNENELSCIEKSLSLSFIELQSFPTQKESNLGVVEYGDCKEIQNKISLSQRKYR